MLYRTLMHHLWSSLPHLSLRELLPTSPRCNWPSRSCSRLFCWPWAAGLWGPWATCTHAQPKRGETSGRWGPVGEFSLLLPEDCFEMQFLYLAENGLMRSSKHLHSEPLPLTFAILGLPSWTKQLNLKPLSQALFSGDSRLTQAPAMYQMLF